MADDEQNAIIPTRAIHEAYLDVQRALKHYRQAVDQASQAEINRAHGEVQESVLTFYEMLRPHIKHNDSVAGYWHGRLPSYPGKNGDVPDPEDGKGVLQIQSHHETVELPADEIDEFKQLSSLQGWHKALDLNGNVRLKGVTADTDSHGRPIAVVSYDAYQIGLRALDDWETEFREVREEVGGFLGSTGKTKRTRERVGMPKLKRAARELADAAKELGFLPKSDVPDNDDALPI